MKGSPPNLLDEINPYLYLNCSLYVENINTNWDGRSAHYAATIIKKNI